MLDKKHKRLKLNDSSDYEMIVSGTDKMVCVKLNCSLHFMPEYVFRPIRMAVKYTLAEAIPDTEGLN